MSTEDAIKVEHKSNTLAELTLPQHSAEDTWQPNIAPLEIIDGQHRLWAFDSANALPGTFELPVVAFYDLDFTWQAYLFYTINIKPKRINTSLAFDLYPLLRIQDWLEQSSAGPKIYRETRAQELTEVLWSHPGSPWKGRINMIGARGGGTISQAAFIRSLLASYVKRWEGPGTSIGGLFGTELQANSAELLNWTRTQQAAFLVMIWQTVSEAVKNTSADWAEALRMKSELEIQPLLLTEDIPVEDPAFASSASLLATDQGVRGVLQVTNDLCYVGAEELRLTTLFPQSDTNRPTDIIDEQAVTEAITQMQLSEILVAFFRNLALDLSKFDWRASSAPGLDENQRRIQMAYRASGGYKALRIDLLRLLSKSNDTLVKTLSIAVQKKLGYS